MVIAADLEVRLASYLFFFCSCAGRRGKRSGRCEKRLRGLSACDVDDFFRYLFIFALGMYTFVL